MSGSNGKENETTQVGLRREVGLVSAVNFMLCFVVGSGIFVTPGTVLSMSGSVGMTLLVWIVCGIISYLACLPFGELSTVIPKSGGVYSYLHTAFTHRHPFFGGLPAFTFFWIMYLITLPCSVALNALLFAEYTFVIAQGIMGEEPISDLELKKHILGALCLVLIGALNCYSVKFYVTTQDLLAYIKMTAIVVIVGSGIYLFASGNALKFNPGFQGTNWTVGSLTKALYFGLYTYDGGCFITTITEEMKNPEKNILRSIMIGLTITTLTYVLLNVTFLTALTPDEIANGTTVIASYATKVFGFTGGALASGIVSLALLSGIMSGMFYASRIGYTAAREGHLPEFMCCILKSRKTPAPAVIAQVILALMYFFIGGNTSVLVDLYSFFVWISYGTTMISLFVLRKQMPDSPRPFRVWSIVPIVVGLISACLFVISLSSGQVDVVIAFVICVVLSCIVFYIFIYKRFRIKNLDKILSKIQDTLGLEPPQEEPPF